VLAKRVKLTVPGLCKSLKRLEAMGEIERERSSGGRNKRTTYVISLGNSKPVDSVLEALNSVSGNTVFKNSISENTKPADTETVNRRLHALNRNRTGNKRESSAQERAFESWYLTYPKHVGQQTALKAWLKLNPDENLTAEISTATENQKRWRGEQAKNPKAFIPEWPNPATWLNGRRWTDECEIRSQKTERPIMPELGA
jgi:hypothetical protein